jgi:hypothetical protein
MRSVRSAFVLALALFSAGCGWRRTPVQVFSDTGSTGLLVGRWSGEYNSRETGRSGSISFELASEKDTAYCDVVMIPAVQNLKIAVESSNQAPVVRQPVTAEPLKVKFVRLGEGRITGTLEPYADPDCACTVSTTFTGRFTGANRIEGTYVTSGRASGKSTTGQWKVARQTVAAATQ